MSESSSNDDILCSIDADAGDSFWELEGSALFDGQRRFAAKLKDLAYMDEVSSQLVLIALEGRMSDIFRVVVLSA